MTMTSQHGSRYVDRPSPSGLADVIDLILDKGLVIDVYVRVSLVGIELITIDARIVVASVDTYLRFAEAVHRLDLTQSKDSEGLPELVSDMEQSGAQRKTKGALEGAKDTVKDFFSGSGDEDEDEHAGTDETDDETDEETDEDEENEEYDEDEGDEEEALEEAPRRRARASSARRERGR